MNGRRVRFSALAVAGVAAGLVGVLAFAGAGTASAASAPAAAAKTAAVPFPGQTPAQIKAKSVAAAKPATSVHVNGTVMDKGKATKFDVVVSGARTRMTLVASATGTEYIVRDGNTLYVGGDQKFWLVASKGALTSKAASALVGKWVKVKATDPKLAPVKTMGSIAFWVNAVNAVKPTKRAAGKVVGGVPTVGLLEPGAAGGTLFVATKGKPYPLSMVAADKSVSAIMTGWNAKFVIALPAKGTII